MAKRKLSPEQLAALEELAQQWGKIVASRAYGDAGPDLDVDFDQMEQIAAAATAGLAEGTLEHLAQQQAQQLPDELPCPTCQKACPVQTRPRKSSHAGPRSRSRNRSPTAPPAAGTFSPQRTEPAT